MKADIAGRLPNLPEAKVMRNTRLEVVSVALSAVALACAGDSSDRIVSPDRIVRPVVSLEDDDPRFSEWSAPVNLGRPVNSGAVEQAPTISKDGLTLIFHCLNCPGNIGANDLWVSERASVDEPWGAPRNLGPAINTEASEASPSLSRDGHLLFFNSNRAGGFGGADIYVARRQDKRDPLGWELPVNLGPGVNSGSDENSPEYTTDENENPALYVTSNRPGGLGGEDIYYATLQSDGTFGALVPVTELNSPFRDSGAGVRKDGLEIYFVSERPGGLGLADIWTSTRASRADPWSTPVNMGTPFNTAGNDAAPALAFDGRTLYFHSANRPDNIDGPFFDIWYATRTKLTGKNGE